MPHLPLTSRLTRRGAVAALGAAVAVGGLAALPAPALASHRQTAIIEDFSDLTDPFGAFAQFRELGAGTVRVLVNWNTVAPDPTATHKPNFNASDPNAYPAGAWATYDNLVAAAKKYGLNLDFTVTGGAPRWAEASAAPPANDINGSAVAWRVNATDYGQFVQAVGKRYPSVHFWSLFNEPNFGQDLGPQASNDSRTATAPIMYRKLVNAGYKGLKASGHVRHNTIVIGELAAKGYEPSRNPRKTGGLPGNYGQTRPLLFIRDLYCVNTRYKELRGGAARAAGCPTNAAGSRRFRRQNPGLFNATGFADHPYGSGASPTSRAGNKVDYATFADLPALEQTLDKVNRVYGSRKHLPIYNTEYGEITNPPNHGHPSPAVASGYMNEAEYISYKSGRIASYMQYLLRDPAPNKGAYSGFSSGLEFYDGKPKATYAAFQLPVYMPHTRFSHKSREEIWGNARPAPFMKRDGNGNQFVQVQVNRRTISRQRVNGGNFDVRLRFPKGRKSVRLAYTFPKSDPFLPIDELGKTIYSRSFTIHVR